MVCKPSLCASLFCIIKITSICRTSIAYSIGIYCVICSCLLCCQSVTPSSQNKNKIVFLDFRIYVLFYLKYSTQLLEIIMVIKYKWQMLRLKGNTEVCRMQVGNHSHLIRLGYLCNFFQDEDFLKYTLKRLIDGLGATREVARPGFSLALAQVGVP